MLRVKNLSLKETRQKNPRPCPTNIKNTFMSISPNHGKNRGRLFLAVGSGSFFWGAGINKRVYTKGLSKNPALEGFSVAQEYIWQGPSAKRNKIENIKCNEVDRLDNSLPHSKENSVPCCKYFNNMKGKMNKNHFLRYVSEIYEH